MNRWWWRDGISDANLEMGCENLTADLLAAEAEIGGILARLRQRVEERERNLRSYQESQVAKGVRGEEATAEWQAKEDERLGAWRVRLMNVQSALTAAHRELSAPLPVLADEPRANKRARYPHALLPVRDGIRAQ